MTGAHWDAVFDEDYLYFYETFLHDERNEKEAELIARLLDLGPGADVLDVPCGHGRIAVRLARRGCRVTGLDASPLFLERARQAAAAAGVGVEWVHGDMRALPFGRDFDAVVNWLTSFGYFDDEENRRVLAEFRRVLRPGGRLLIETVHRDRILRSLPPGEPVRFDVVRRGDDLMIDRTGYEPLTGRVQTDRTIVRDGRVRRFAYGLRLYTPVELRDELLRAGFARVELLGDEGGPLTLDSRRLLAVAQA